ncbi:hypothetical protein V5O48_001019 [Marasmius crinis-equi]|uniref:Malic enzyme n=1 Tax=Marasmius crinis-equi TaxID=585013 RepID=A0ABR3G0B7_9AGAR
MPPMSPQMPPSPQLPPYITDTDHRQRSLQQLRAKTTDLEKYLFLNTLKERNPAMFYDILIENMMEVGEACMNYSHIWSRPEGLYVSLEHKGRIREILRSWPAGPAARIAVVTDGSRILGLGDLGANGLPISIGKLDLYVAGAGIVPSSTLPICLDVGTNTQKYLDDPLYIGRREKRPDVKEMEEFMEEFMGAMHDVFPELLIQFEDFSTDNAFKFLDRFQNRYPCFNDDIQGTGAVVLSGFVNAAKLASEASGASLKDHKILFFGAGSSGIGVAKQLLSFFRVQGMSEEEAKARIYTVDSKGLITADREGLQQHKKFFARTDYDGPPLKKLEDIVEYVRPTALLGLSTTSKAFNEDVIKLMAQYNKRPIIFPLSNPVSLSEVDFKDALEWTDGSVIFASGSPYDPVEYPKDSGSMHEAGQGNNMYMFPGIGLGAILSKAKQVTDGMIEQASLALSSCLTDEEKDTGLVYPKLTRIREISATVALRVAREAAKEGVDNNVVFRSLSDEALLEHVKDKMWDPSKSYSRGRM